MAQVFLIYGKDEQNCITSKKEYSPTISETPLELRVCGKHLLKKIVKIQ